MFDGANGWAISSAESSEDLARRDQLEADNLYQVLERQVVPLFYDRRGEVPEGWLRRVKASLASLGPQVVADRMVRDYVARLYEPMAERDDVMRASGHARARALSAWKQHVRAGWPHVSVETLNGDSAPTDLGEERVVEAVVNLGQLSPDDVTVELLHGPVGPDGETRFTGNAMVLAGSDHERGRYRYTGRFTCQRAGNYGYTARVVPTHPDLANPAEMGCVAWA